MATIFSGSYDDFIVTNPDGTEDRVLRLKGSGTLSTSGISNCQILMIGGGGSGGNENEAGGGGGAGGALSGTLSIISGNYSIVIGNGGAGNRVNGGNTTAFGFTAFGGGGGGSGSPWGGAAGGCGGGAEQAHRGGGGSIQTSQSPLIGYGTIGGNSQGEGGGGGGGLGENGITGNPGRGGNGKVFNITGINVTYGGGGGGAREGSCGGAAGGSGGGGNGGGGGGAGGGNCNGGNASAYGSGGGGTRWAAPGNGYQGVVILRFLNCLEISTSKTGNGTISSGKCSEPGTDYDVIITPDPNHYIKSLFINGTEVTVSPKDKRGFTYNLTNIQESYDFQVEFAQGFKITSNICTGGSIVPNYSKCMLGELV